MKKEDSEKFGFTRIIILNTISVLLILLSITGLFNPVYSFTDYSTRSLRGKVNSFATEVNDALGTLANLGEIKKERDSFEQKIFELENENTKLLELKSQIEILQKQLNTKFNYEFQLTAANVISLDIKDQGLARIDRGKDSGIEAGDVVVIENFAVGEVIKVDNYTSEILLITSPQSEITVISQRNNTKGILTGRFGGGLIVNNILQTDKTEIGENFVTLGVNSNYPSGLFVGKVSEVSEVQTETKKSATLNNYVDFDSLRYVFVLKLKR